MAHSLVGNSSSTTKIAIRPLTSKTNHLQLSEGDASSGIFNTQKHVLEDKIEYDCEDGFPLFADALPWNIEEEDHHVDKEGAPNRCALKLSEVLLELH